MHVYVPISRREDEHAHTCVVIGGPLRISSPRSRCFVYVVNT